MPRLTQSNSVVPSSSSVSTPHVVEDLTPSVQKVVTPTVQPLRRRYPLWFFPALLTAVGLTGTELWNWQAKQAHRQALDNAQISQTRHRSGLPIRGGTYAVSPKGDKFAVAYIVDKDSYQEVRRISGELLWKTKDAVVYPVFSQDGARLFNGSEVFDAETGRRLTQIPRERSGYGYSWDSQGSRAVWNRGVDVQVWDKTTNKTRTLVIPEKDEFDRGMSLYSSGTCISPDGKWVSTLVSNGRSDESRVLLWNLATPGKPRAFPVQHDSGGAVSLAFSPNSKALLYTGEKRTGDTWSGQKWVGAWDVNTGRTVLNVYPEERGSLVAWSPDSRYAVVRDWNVWSLYEVATGKRVWQTPVQEKSVFNAITFTEDKKLYFYESDEKKNERYLKYWDLAKVLNKK